MSTRTLDPAAKRALLERINSGDGGQRDRPFHYVSVDRAAINEDDRVLRMSFSSEEPVERWWGVEILDHQAKSVDLTRFRPENLAPLLVNHCTSDQVGVVLEATINEKRKRCEATVKIGQNSERQNEIFGDIRDGIRGNVSVGYEILDVVLEQEKKGQPPVYRVTKWRPLEVSIVSIPADMRVGVGRSAQSIPTATGNQRREVHMDPTQILNPPGADGSEPAAAAATTTPPAPDIRSVANDAAAAERARIQEITAIGDRARDKGGVELARQFVSSGRSVDEFRSVIMERMYGDQPRVPDPPVVGLSPKEAKRYSLLKVIHAAANPMDRRAQADAAFEFEVSDAALRASGRNLRGGAQFCIPPEVLGHRDLFLGTASGTASNLVQTDVLSDSFIEILRNKAMVVQAGATVLSGLQGNVAIPRRSGASVAAWVAEGGAAGESTAVSFDQVTLSPKTISAWVDYSRKTLLQPSLSVENLLRMDLFAVLGLAIDAAAINGNGTSPIPSGIIPTTAIGTSSMGAQAAAITWTGIVAPETAVATGNADVGKLAYMLSPAVRGIMKTTVKSSTGVVGFMMEPDGTVNGYPAYVTNQVPTNLTYGTTTGSAKSLIFGNWADLLIGLWSGVDILVDQFSASTTGNVRIVALQDVDIAFRQSASFNKLLGIS